MGEEQDWKIYFYVLRKTKNKKQKTVQFHVFVPDEKKNKCQNAHAELAEFSSSSVARAALCTCSDLHLRGVRSISARKNFRFTLVVALAASWFQKYGLVVLNCSAKTLQSKGNRGTK